MPTAVEALEAFASEHQLFLSGAFHSAPEHHLPADGTLFLLSPNEPGFWAHLTASPEFRDAAPDPIDRWSSRVISDIASKAGGTAYLPFGGPPWHPFITWALASNAARPSPVTLLVHDRMGLWASWRGAVWIEGRHNLPSPADPPCVSCEAPCLQACPVGALTPSGYDTEACHRFLDQPEENKCLTHGCVARAACPLSETYGRLPEQSAWHMRHFHR